MNNPPAPPGSSPVSSSGSSEAHVSAESSVADKPADSTSAAKGSTGGTNPGGRARKIVLGLCILVFIFAIVYGVYIFVSEPWSDPVNVRVSNVTSRSATVSWVTRKPTKGLVIYSSSDDFMPSILAKQGKELSFDDRDVNEARLLAAEREQENIASTESDEIDYAEVDEDVIIESLGEYYVHHVTLRGLEPETQYYFRVGNGMRFTLETEENAIFKTSSELEDLPVPSPAYGLIRLWGDEEKPVSDGIVYMTLSLADEVSDPVSSVLSENGSWYIDLNNVRNASGEIFLSTVGEDVQERVIEHLEIETATFGLYSKDITVGDDAPADTILVAHPESEEYDPDLVLEGWTISDDEDDNESAFVSYIYAADCGGGYRDNCSVCTGSSNCEEGCNYVDGEQTDCGFMGYCQKKYCSSSDDPPDCECGCVDGPTHCSGGLVCKKHKCVSDTPEEEPASPPPSQPSGGEYEGCTNGYGPDCCEKYEGGECMDPSVCKENGGTVEHNKCPGGQDNKCCKGYTPGGMKVCCCDGETLRTAEECAYCSNPTAGECSVTPPGGYVGCTNGYGPECCELHEGGECMDPDVCRKNGGSVEDNKCPGGQDNKCCKGYTPGGMKVCCCGGKTLRTAEECAYCSNPTSGECQNTCCCHGQTLTDNAACNACDDPNKESGACPGATPASATCTGSETLNGETCDASGIYGDCNTAKTHRCTSVEHGECTWDKDESCTDTSCDGTDEEGNETCSTDKIGDCHSYLHLRCSSAFGVLNENCTWREANDCPNSTEVLKCQGNSILENEVCNHNNFGDCHTKLNRVCDRTPDGQCSWRLDYSCPESGGSQEGELRCIGEDKNGWNEVCNSSNFGSCSTAHAAYCARNGDGYCKWFSPHYSCPHSQSEDSACNGSAERKGETCSSDTNYNKCHSTLNRRCAMSSVDGGCIWELDYSCPEFENSSCWGEDSRDGQVCNATAFDAGECHDKYKLRCQRANDGQCHWEFDGYCQPGSSVKRNDLLVLGVGAKGTNIGNSQVLAAEESILLVPKEGLFAFEDAGTYSVQIGNETYYIEIDRPGVWNLYADLNGNGLLDDEDVVISDVIEEITVLSKSSTFEYKLSEGFNFVSFPFAMTGVGDGMASSLLEYLNTTYGDKFYSIAKYDSGWVIVGNRDGTTYKSEDFQIVPGRGYLIRTKEDVDVTIIGKSVLEPVPAYMREGWNLVGVHGATKSYTAEGVIDDVSSQEGFAADNVTQWDVSRYRYDGLQKEGGEVYGFDFPIEDKISYFVRLVEGDGNWTPE